MGDRGTVTRQRVRRKIQPFRGMPSCVLPMTTLQEVQQSEAVQLFRQRAAAALPEFALAARNAPAIVTLTRRLDGIPLALELAAARMTVLSAEQIAARLDHALLLLTSGSRTAPARQQTLQATLDWSVKLLSRPACGNEVCTRC